MLLKRLNYSYNLKHMRKSLLSVITFCFLFLVSKLTAFTVYAQVPSPSLDKFSATIGGFYNVLYPIAIIYGVVEIIFAGYKIMRSEGEPKALSEAKEHLTNSIVGVIFVILAIVILKIVLYMFIM
jgi:hypothetical protein